MRPLLSILILLTLFAAHADPREDWIRSKPVHDICIEIADTHLRALQVQPREYVPAKVTLDRERVPVAFIQLKGAGSFQTINEKPSLTISFVATNAPHGFRGETKIHLNNSAQDPTCLRDTICSDMAAMLHLPVQRTAHATVLLNGRPLGLYVMKEGITERFLQANFHQPGGIYEKTLGDLDKPLRLQAGITNNASIRALTDAASEAASREKWAALQAALDVERMATFMAFETIIGHWDGYSLGLNNYRLFLPSSPDSKALFIPAGMDQTFAKPNAAWNPQMSGLVASAFVSCAEGQALYEQALKQVSDTLFGKKNWDQQISARAKALEPFIPKTEKDEWREEVSAFREQVAARHEYLLKNLRGNKRLRTSPSAPAASPVY